MSDQDAVITLREVYDKLSELAATVTSHMSRQDTQHALLEQRVAIVERDFDRHSRDADKRYEDLKSDHEREAAELRSSIDSKKNRTWMGWTALIGAAAAIAAAVIPLFSHA